MQYKCQECNDTGGRDKIGAYFDCNACDTATTRRDLNDFVKSLTQRSTYPVHPEDVALAIHQRALAMAPKQEAPTQEPVAYLVFAEDHNGMAPQHPAYSTHLQATRCASMFGQTPTEIRPLYDHAAPAAANGAPGYAEKSSPIAITDSSALNGIKWYVPPPEHLRNSMQLYFVAPQPVAAAGPDAALVKALEDIAAIEDKMVGGDWEEIDEARTIARAALSGAKGN